MPDKSGQKPSSRYIRWCRFDLAPARIGAAGSSATLDVETASQDRVSVRSVGVVTVEE